MKKCFLVLKIILIFYIFSSAGQASTFNLFFYDQNNTKVGQGLFTIDFNKTICVEAHPLGNCNNNPSVPVFPGEPTQYEFGYVVDRQNPLSGFSVNVQGISWGLDHKSWWSAEGQSPGYQYWGRYGVFLFNQWFFGDEYGYRQLAFYFNQATNTFGRGTWMHQVTLGQDGNPLPEPIFGAGTWSTIETPIPSAIYLFASACVIFFRNRRKANGLRRGDQC